MDERSVDQPSADEPRRFDDWPSKRDAIRAALRARTPELSHAGPLNPARGAVVAPDSLEPRVYARAEFLAIAAAVQPELLVDLAGEPLDAFAAAWDESGWPSAANVDDDDLEDFWVLLPTMGPHHLDAVFRWCQRWGLPSVRDLPVSVMAALLDEYQRTGDQRYLNRFDVAWTWGWSEAIFTLKCWRALNKWIPPELPFGKSLGHHSGVVSPGVVDAELGLGRALSLPAPRWNPQREDRAAATTRITAELGRAVRAELGRIEDEARTVGVPPPAKRTGREHLAWLARHHFRHESFSAIAKDVCKERQTVTEAVKDAAELVGLPLREPTRGGRVGGARRGPDLSG